jgi:hypothetical protein
MKQRRLQTLDEDLAIARMQELSTQVLRIREQTATAK